MWWEFSLDTSSSNIVVSQTSEWCCFCVKYIPACYFNSAHTVSLLLSSMPCVICSPTALKLELSGWMSDLRCKKTRYMQLLILPPTPVFFSFMVLTPPSLFPLTPSVFFLICPELQQHPPSPSLSLLLFFLICLQLTPHTSHSFLSLNLLTPFLPFSFISPLIPPHFLFPPSLPLRNDSSTFPWQNQRRESNDQLLSLHLVSELELWKKALSPKPFIASGGMSCVVHTGKDFGLTGILGAHGKMWASEDLNSLWHLLPQSVMRH